MHSRNFGRGSSIAFFGHGDRLLEGRSTQSEQHYRVCVIGSAHNKTGAIFTQFPL